MCVAATVALGAEVPPASPGAAPKIGPETVIVTAERRRERSADVPVTVTLATRAALAASHVQSITNIRALSPAIRFTANANAASSSDLQIRGIGTAGSSRAFEGAVGVFVDGVYRTRAGELLEDFLDIDTLQILEGPQGTLFGKNTSAGAVLLTSGVPDTRRVSGSYEASYGNYSTDLLRASVNIPVSDKVAVRVAGMVADHAGYVTNPGTGQDYDDHHDKAIKAQLLYQPTQDVDLRLIADYAHEHENCCFGAVDAVSGPTAPLVDALTRANGLLPPPVGVPNYQQTLNSNAEQLVTDEGIEALADWRTPAGGTLHSVTAARFWKLSQANADADYSGADLLRLNESFRSAFLSQELTYGGRLDHPPLADSLDYLVGAYAASEDIVATRDLVWGSQAQDYFNILLHGTTGLPFGTVNATPGVFTREYMPAHDQSTSLFTQETLHRANGWSLIGGLRLSNEQTQGAYTNIYFSPHANDALTVLGVQPGPNYDRTHADTALSGTAGVQYRFDPHWMSYLTYSRGFKAGGVNIDSNGAGGVANNPRLVPGAVPLDPTFKPEFVDAIEFGVKGEYWNGRGRTDVALFHDDLHDLQVAQFLGLRFVILNARSAELTGGEITNHFRVTDEIGLKAAATWLPEATYGSSPELGYPLSGRRFADTPRVSADIAATLQHDLSDKYTLLGRAALRYQTTEFDGTATDGEQGNYALLDLSLGLRSVARGWTLELSCQNCLDTRYYTQHFQAPLQAGELKAYVGAPLTYGVRLLGEF